MFDRDVQQVHVQERRGEQPVVAVVVVHGVREQLPVAGTARLQLGLVAARAIDGSPVAEVGRDVERRSARS